MADHGSMHKGLGDTATDFDARYRVAGNPVMRRVEHTVIGCDYGATSYTTKAQADRLAGLWNILPELDLGVELTSFDGLHWGYLQG